MSLYSFTSPLFTYPSSLSHKICKTPTKKRLKPAEKETYIIYTRAGLCTRRKNNTSNLKGLEQSYVFPRRRGVGRQALRAVHLSNLVFVYLVPAEDQLQPHLPRYAVLGAKSLRRGEGEARLRPVRRHVNLHCIRVEDAHRPLPHHLHHPWESAHNLGDLKLGEEYEQWRDHIKPTEGGRRLVNTSTAPKTHARPQHRQNTQRKNLKTHKNNDTLRGPLRRDR